MASMGLPSTEHFIDPMLPDGDEPVDIKNLREKGKDVRLVVFDLDGTLLNSKHEISEYSLLAIRELLKKEIVIAIASGRIFTMLEGYIHTLNHQGFVISSNGGGIDDLSKHQRIKQVYLDPSDSEKIVLFCYSQQIECNILKRQSCYFPMQSVRISRFDNYNKIAIEKGLSPIVFNRYERTIDDYALIEKILIYENNPMKVKKVKKFIETHTQLAYTSSGDGLMDVSSQEVSKGRAVEIIAKELGISLDQVCVFGDYDNDVSMFKTAGIAIAMGNASHQAKKHADFITLSHDEEGIAYAIREILL
jgi:Cof subfamily protein (haloacid dehalogenase superfamily)